MVDIIIHPPQKILKQTKCLPYTHPTQMSRKALVTFSKGNKLSEHERRPFGRKFVVTCTLVAVNSCGMGTYASSSSSLNHGFSTDCNWPREDLPHKFLISKYFRVRTTAVETQPSSLSSLLQAQLWWFLVSSQEICWKIFGKRGKGAKISKHSWQVSILREGQEISKGQEM